MRGKKGQLNKSISHNIPYTELSVKKIIHFNGTSPLARFVPLTASMETLKYVAQTENSRESGTPCCHLCSLPLRTVKLAYSTHKHTHSTAQINDIVLIVAMGFISHGNHPMSLIEFRVFLNKQRVLTGEVNIMAWQQATPMSRRSKAVNPSPLEERWIRWQRKFKQLLGRPKQTVRCYRGTCQNLLSPPPLEELHPHPG